MNFKNLVMKKIMAIVVLGFVFILSSCAKDEECVCEKSANITESDAKDVGVTLEDACQLAKIGDDSCIVE